VIGRALALGVAALLSGCAGRVADGGRLTLALANSPANLDPAVGLDEASQKVHQLLYCSLLRVDESLRVVPDLATRFDSDGDRAYVAEIPPGVRFHDGREMTAADVAFTFRRFLDPALVSGRKGAYRTLDAVDIVGQYAVRFRLKAPSASFPINLVMGIVPAGTPPAVRTPVGSGPYRLSVFRPDDRVELTAFDDYHGGPPANRGLTLKVVPDETMRGLELRHGSVDLVVNDLSPDVVDGLRRLPHLRVTSAAGTDYAYLGFNLRDPLLRDRRVRWAIGAAIDRDSIIDHLRRGLARRTSSIVPDMSWAHRAAPEPFEFDPARAARLLDEAGFRDPDGSGPTPRLRLTLKTSTAEAYRLQAAVIQQNLARVGVAVDVRTSEFATLLADVVRGNVQLYTLQYVGVTDPDMLRRAFHSRQTPPDGFNRGHYANGDVDEAIEAAALALDEASRHARYGEAQRLVAYDAPYISLWARNNTIVSQATLEGVVLSPIADFGFLRHVRRRQ
jgi:peptide/nickel transport system substrate-binding protein